MKDRDEKIAREVLKTLYEQFEEDQFGSLTGKRLYEELSDFEKEDINYVVERMEDEFVEVLHTMGARLADVTLRMEGIDKLHSEGYETFLDDNERYEILEFLYKIDRDNQGQAIVSREGIIENVGASGEVVDMNVRYLKEKGLIKTLGMGGGRIFTNAEITKRGAEKYEAYVDDGVEIPETVSKTTSKQMTLGPDEPDKAENLFRDFVELTREEIVIIDRFAREGLYDLLKHAPSGVQINVLTSDRVTGGDYRRRVRQFSKQHRDIDVRYIPDGDWDFHDRYIIRDGKDGWAWGHSFHDSGKTQHTASELKPINRDTIIGQSEDAWSRGRSVI